MVLYEQKKDGFDVYEMKEKEKEAAIYRRREMENGGYDKSCFYSRFKVYYYMEKDKIFGRYSKEEIADSILSGHDFERFITKRFLITINREFLETLLNQYYNGDFKKYSIARFKTGTGTRNFLLTSEEYERRQGCFYSDNILEVPDSLQILQTLEQGRFQSLQGENISEQIKLFTASKVDEVSIKELQKMDACGVTTAAYEKASNKAQSDAYVLKLLRK